MPKYTYQCSTCDFIQEKRHRMFEAYEYCPNCESEGDLTKIPSVIRVFGINEPSSHTKKTGELVTSFIEEIRTEIGDEKQKLREEYKPS